MEDVNVDWLNLGPGKSDVTFQKMIADFNNGSPLPLFRHAVAVNGIDSREIKALELLLEAQKIQALYELVKSVYILNDTLFMERS